MSPVFIDNTDKICSQVDRASAPTISLHNTQIRTLINIYPPNSTLMPPLLPQNYTMNPIDLRKHTPSTVAAQAFYHFYFPHLFSLQNQLQSNETIDRGIKRSSTISNGKSNITYSTSC